MDGNVGRAALAAELVAQADFLGCAAVSGAAAGVANNVAFFPADTVKSTMQTEEVLRPRAVGEPGRTFLGTFRAMYRAQGISGLYAGCGITVARAIPSSALIFLIYDGLSQRFG